LSVPAVAKAIVWLEDAAGERDEASRAVAFGQRTRE